MFNYHKYYRHHMSLRKFVQVIIVLFAANYSAHALGNEFKQGYIITLKNDTIRGLISNDHQDAYLFVDFKLKDGAKDTIFSPKGLLGYEVGDQIFRTVHIPFENDTLYSFAKILVEGKITLYKTKLKLDRVLKPKEAYLYIKEGETSYKPAGKVNSLLPAIEDNKTLSDQVKNHFYKDDEASKIIVCKRYNEGK